MKALVINCTLKPSPEPSNTHALAEAVGDELEKSGVDVEYVRAVDLNLLPGVKTEQGDGAHHVIAEIAGALGDIGYTIPGNAWTYWHLGPGKGPDYLDAKRGHDWSDETGRTMAQNLHTTATALAADKQAAAEIPPAE